MGKAATRTDETNEFDKLTIPELEAAIAKNAGLEQTAEVKRVLRILRATLSMRKKMVKAQVMDFEETNNHHLLMYDSTSGFRKMAGTSVLLFSMKVATRLGRQCKVMQDRDNYSRSDDGVISIRAIKELEEKLATIDIFPDEELSHDEFHYYKLPRVYTMEQIEKLRDFARQDLEKIQEIILPDSPIPTLYAEILELNQLVYFGLRDISDRFARDTIGVTLMRRSDMILQNYLHFANVRTQTTRARYEAQIGVARTQSRYRSMVDTAEAQNMLNLFMNVILLKHEVANLENLRLVRPKRLGRILEKIVSIERTAEREYGRLLREAMAERERSSKKD